MQKKFIALLPILLLAACASATKSIDSSYVLEPGGESGVATGSISYAGRFSGYAVHYRNLDTGKVGRIQIGESQALLPISPKSEFDDPELVGMVFAVPLAVGDYEFFRWTVGSGLADVSSTVPFSIRFRIEPGKLVYTGSFQFTQTAGIGLTVSGATLAYKDAASRDLPVMGRKFPSLALAGMSSAAAPGTDVPDVGGSSIVRFTLPVIVPIAP